MYVSGYLYVCVCICLDLFFLVLLFSFSECSFCAQGPVRTGVSLCLRRGNSERMIMPMVQGIKPSPPLLRTEIGLCPYRQQYVLEASK